MNEEIKVLLAKIEALEWSTNKEGDNLYRLGKYSPAGQDFSIVVEGEDAKELIQAIYQSYENYDVSEEAYLWLDNTGHGRNGAPYEMKDVVVDMEACERMILDLHQELTKANQS